VQLGLAQKDGRRLVADRVGILVVITTLFLLLTSLLLGADAFRHGISATVHIIVLAA
jgi:hypothetical protein